MTDAIRPFRIAVDDAVLADLRQRLRATRWPDAETVDDWSQGAPLAWIRDMCAYWADGYDWRAREARLSGRLFPAGGGRRGASTIVTLCSVKYPL